MATEKVTAQVTGEAAADGTGAGGWLIFGFLLPLIGVLVAYLRNPKVPAKVLAARPDDNASVARVFEVAYIERLKAKQVGNAWIGAAIGVSVVVRRAPRWRCYGNWAPCSSRKPAPCPYRRTVFSPA